MNLVPVCRPLRYGHYAASLLVVWKGGVCEGIEVE